MRIRGRLNRYLLWGAMGLLAASISLPGKTEARSRNGSSEYLDYTFKTIDGEKTKLSDFRGDVLLVVNVASKCGFTPQYEGLEALQREYGDKGFKVIGFPANDFLNQEPGSNEEILSFCKETYDVTFPMMAKIHVKGKDQHPLYTYLTEESPFPGPVTWNFNKFLLDRDGKVVARFGSRTKPGSEEVVQKIVEVLGLNSETNAD